MSKSRASKKTKTEHSNYPMNTSELPSDLGSDVGSDSLEEKLEEEPKQEELKSEKPKEDIPDFVVEDITGKREEEKPISIPLGADDKRPLEEKIVEFLKLRNGSIELNGFLKSQFPVLKFNVVPQWEDQLESKKIRKVLEFLVNSGQITISGNAHLKLGKHYYEEGTNIQKHYSIGKVRILASAT